MFTFVSTDEDGLPQKRKQTQKACKTCRKRKKRCHHAEPGQESNMAPPARSGEPSTTTPMAIAIGGSPPSSTIHPHSDGAIATPATHRSSFHEDGSPQFVGDLNPEGVFLTANIPTSPAGAARPDGVGVWLSHSAAHALLGRNATTQSRVTDSFRSKLLLPYIEDQCLRLLPARQDIRQLQRIYWEEIAPIFPVLDRAAFEVLQDNSPEKVILTQAICLAASFSSKATKFLNLANLSVLSHKDFVDSLLLAMRLGVNFGQPYDTLVSIQAFALISLFTQLSTDRHLSTDFTGRAVSFSHTAGLHLKLQVDRRDGHYLRRLFLCVWALDRLNAAFHGRPVLIHERDFDFDLEPCFVEQEPCFQLFLRNVLLLDQVIHLYRPIKDASPPSWEHEFPTFEELVNASGATRVNSNLLATIETLYHAVAMLSYRPQEPLQECSRNTTSYLRQTLAAIKVTSLVGQEFRGQLSMLPIVPYAVSLSLRASYRDLRISKAPIFQTRARRQLLATCALLKGIGQVYQSANNIADLAEQIIREMGKVVTQFMNTQQTEDSEDRELDGVNGHNVGLAESLAQRRKLSLFDAYGRAPNNVTNITVGQTDEANTNWDSVSFDASLFDNVPDFDIFEHLNPDFDLAAIDATFIENADLSFPV